MSKHKTAKSSAPAAEPTKPDALESEELVSTPALDDESLDSDIPPTEGEEFSTDAVGTEAPPPVDAEPSLGDPPVEGPTDVIPTRKQKAGRQVYMIWPHGSLRRNGVTYAPGDRIELNAEQAKGIECLIPAKPADEADTNEE